MINKDLRPFGVADYEFVAPSQVIFGWGRRAEVARLLKPLARRVFLVTGSRTVESAGPIHELISQIMAAGMEVIRLGAISREPEVADVDNTVKDLSAYNPCLHDSVLAIGGGSAIDLAKAVAALALERQSETVVDYLEGVGRGLQITRQAMSIVAVPTTAGTGSEATKNAVISSYDPPFKKSLRSPRIVPRLVVIDPELSCTLPPGITARTGMDAITQLIESYVSRRATPVTRAVCLAALPGVFEALQSAVIDGQCRPARERMAQAAFLSGVALANSGLGMAHGLAAALGVHGRVPHGLACAAMLPIAIEANRPVCESDFAHLAEVILRRKFDSDDMAVETLTTELAQLSGAIGIPRRISALGIPREMLAGLVRDSRGSSMSGNPRDLSDSELEQILAAHW